MRLNADGTKDPTFQTLSASYYSSVQKILRRKDGKLLVCGEFRGLGGRNREGLALLNPDGSLVREFSPALSDAKTGYPRVMDMVLQDDQSLVITGQFDRIGADSVSCLARLRPDGSLDREFLAGAGPNRMGTKLALGADGSLFVTGSFDRVGTSERLGLAKFTPLPVLTARAYDAAGTFQFSVGAGVGRRIRIERSGDLKDWTVLGTYTNGMPSVEVIHADRTSPAQFYRVWEW